jgi:[ribosomal protein S5]-alanine N-acetyltransferase
MNIIAQTPRFVIRNFTAEEEATYLSLFEDEDVIEHLPQRSLKENIAIFHTALNDYAEGKALGRWGIFNNGDNDFIGVCLLRAYNYEPGKVELGYVLNKKFWGKGIASEMARIMVAYGFMHTGANEIVAVTSLGNTGSQKVLEKAGLKRMPNFKRDGQELAYFRVEKLARS